jgi:hypothetical protein
MAEAVQKKHSKSEYYVAYVVYGLVFVTFVTVCSVAVFLTNQRESEKTGFKAIETDAPISFFDKTYVKKKKDSQ